MLNTIIIEDEGPNRELLIHRLHQIDPSIKVKATLGSVTEALSYFTESQDRADLIFSDIQLGDGSSFDVFKQVSINIPVIFTTSSEYQASDALAFNGIGYICKPIQRNDLIKLLQKYLAFQQHFKDRIRWQNNAASVPVAGKRVLVKKRKETFPIAVDNLIYFYSQDHLSYVVCSNGSRFILEKSLSEIETGLDSKQFFRSSRRDIINVDFIKSFKPVDGSKLQVELTSENHTHSVIVSKDNACAFKKWIGAV